MFRHTCTRECGTMQRWSSLGYLRPDWQFHQLLKKDRNITGRELSGAGSQKKVDLTRVSAAQQQRPAAVNVFTSIGGGKRCQRKAGKCCLRFPFYYWLQENTTSFYVKNNFPSMWIQGSCNKMFYIHSQGETALIHGISCRLHLLFFFLLLSPRPLTMKHSQREK